MFTVIADDREVWNKYNEGGFPAPAVVVERIRA